VENSEHLKSVNEAKDNFVKTLKIRFADIAAINIAIEDNIGLTPAKYSEQTNKSEMDEKKAKFENSEVAKLLISRGFNLAYIEDNSSQKS